MIYEKLCRVSSRTPLFSRISKRKDDKDLTRAVRFLAPIMKVTVEGIVAAAYLSALLVLIGASLSLLFFGVDFLIIVPLSAMLCVLVYYIVINYPVSMMNSYKLGLSEEADIVYEQFILVFQTGGTIFDAIEMVAQSEHPYLSKAFQMMLERISEGVPPEECLMEFAKDQPSDDIRRYFTTIVSSRERRTELLDEISGESYEADLALRQKNLELESRILIVSALVTYVPIMLTLAVSLSGYATQPIVILLAPLFIFLNAILRSRFSRQFSAYFDRPRASSIIPPTQNDILMEYDEFLNFLILLGQRLSLGDTLEVALAEIRDDLEPTLQRLIDIAMTSIYQEHTSSLEAMQRASDAAIGQRVSQMLKMIALMSETSTYDTGERISKIAARLIKRSAVAKERDSIIAAQRLKVYLLTITSAAVLGMLASLAPFLFIGSLLSHGPTWTPGSLSALDIAPLLITLGITTLSMGYQNTRMVGGRRPLLISLVCMLLFWVAFAFSSTLMGLNLV
ncbi:MAG: type II secretion system F family protein [Candidatus Thorarchaeota archaeon]|nr:type II secretion system F family protein [Candidatus Thorarchaeota archaeon]